MHALPRPNYTTIIGQTIAKVFKHDAERRITIPSSLPSSAHLSEKLKTAFDFPIKFRFSLFGFQAESATWQLLTPMLC